MMETIKTYSFPRAGLLGNPSDGYFGKTISFAFSEFGVEMTLDESARMKFTPGVVDDSTFASPEDLVRDVRLYGYYGGIRLLKATAKRFFEYCMDNGIAVPRRNFTASYKINIPRLVGMSGSSAICSAMLKALMKFYEVEIPLEVRPTLCLEAERELGINCGFQDRVIQIYNGLVFMDFDREYLNIHNYGKYERLDPAVFSNSQPPTVDFQPTTFNLYIAYDANRAEESGKAHADVKARFEEKKADVLSAMSEFADIARQGRDLLVKAGSIGSDCVGIGSESAGEGEGLKVRFAELINANFDLRDRIFNVAPENRRMVMTARSAGASAKFAGSGGAIVGTFENEEQYERLVRSLATIGCTVFKPTIAVDDSILPPSIAAKWRDA